VKSVERSQTYGMLGAVCGATLLWVITISLATSVFGYEFLGTAAYNLLEGVGVQTDPTITLLAGVLTGSPLVCILVSLGFMFWMWMWIPGMHTFGVRAIVAGGGDHLHHVREHLVHGALRLHRVFLSYRDFDRGRGAGLERCAGRGNLLPLHAAPDL
jgi:hypothetical protein